MRLTIRNVVLVAAAVLAGVVFSPPVAQANPWGDVDCSQFPEHADCQTDVGTPGAPAWTVTPAGDVVCRNDSGEVVDCYIEGQGWIGADGCRYYFNGSDFPPEDATGPGGWYVRTCYEVAGGGVVWLADADVPGPGWLAQIAASRLSLPPPVIGLSPPASAPQLVMLPTWLWVEPQWWETGRSASASVPGITVVAVATPTEVHWSTGDGDEYVCGQGTPYTAAEDPAAASPD